MKKIIRKNEEKKFGWEWVEIDENGNENIIDLNKKTTDNYLYLPENEFNRRLIGMNFLEKQGDEWEVTMRNSTPKISNNQTTIKKGLEEYLDDDDKALYLALVEKAIQNRDKMKNDPVAKAKAKYEAALKAYEALLNQ